MHPRFLQKTQDKKIYKRKQKKSSIICKGENWVHRSVSF